MRELMKELKYQKKMTEAEDKDRPKFKMTQRNLVDVDWTNNTAAASRLATASQRSLSAKRTYHSNSPNKKHEENLTIAERLARLPSRKQLVQILEDSALNENQLFSMKRKVRQPPRRVEKEDRLPEDHPFFANNQAEINAVKEI